MLRIPGIKIFSDDGSCLTPATTFNFIPPGDPPLGDLFLDQTTMDAAVIETDSNGYQMAIHAIGDRGRDMALTAIDHALAGRFNSLHHRIDHDTFFRPDQIAQYARIGIVPTAFTTRTYLDNADPLAARLPDFAQPWFRPLPAMLA